jgi:prepilin-type N-terminal cleavage/methylation domain-containing protein
MSSTSRHNSRPASVFTIGESRVAAFTLLELLAVITIIGVLAALVIPTVTSVHASADRVRTRVQFEQWVIACAQFRQEYGYLPVLGTGNKLKTAADTQAFVRMLSGRNLDGSEVADSSDLMGNTKRIMFHAFADSELQNGLLTDAFGNTEFGVICDMDGDGLVKPGIDGVVPSVQSIAGATFTPSGTDLPASGVRAGVIFYSPGRGSVDFDLILSWK